MRPQLQIAVRFGGALAVLAGAAFLAGQVSLALVPVALLAAGVGVVYVFHRPSRFRSRFVERNDLYFIDWCRCAPAVLSVRHLYRRLPSNPRCRICMVPFAGFGKLLGIRPSRKNPNFCPS